MKCFLRPACALWLLSCHVVLAQDNMAKLNLTVPDNPAFKALGKEPSTILRPSEVKDFSVLADQFQGSNFILPKDFGIEVGPASLGRWVTLKQYQENGLARVLQSWRVSGAVSTDPDSVNYARRLAFGTRLTLYRPAEADIYRNKALSKKLDMAVERGATDIANLGLAARKALPPDANGSNPLEVKFSQDLFILTSNVTDGSVIEHRLDSLLATSEYKPLKENIEFMVYYKETWIKPVGKEYDEMKAVQERYKKIYAEKTWSYSGLDFAYSWTGQTKSDTLGRTVENLGSNFWLTGYKRLGETWQGVFNAYAQASPTGKTILDRGSLAARLYHGSNRIKGFAEVQVTYDNPRGYVKSHYLIGAEAGVSNGVWLNFYLGPEDYLQQKDTGFTKQLQSGLVYHVDIRFTLNRQDD